MTTRAALTPAGALGWLGSLSVDVRAALDGLEIA